MMKKIGLLVISLIMFAATMVAQSKINIYHPEADARQQIDSALTVAAQANKHVLIQVGGNWCPWCVMLHNFFKSDAQIDSLLQSDYVFMTLNYSKENKNLDILEQLEFPQRFGFPVLVILNADGKRLHTQNTVYLEEGKGYNQKRVFGFLMDWRPLALNKASYEK